MSTERELAERFKEAIETKNIDGVFPYLTEGMTYEVLPSTVGRKMAKVEWRDTVNGLFARVSSAKLEIVNVTERPLFVVVQANVTLAFPDAPFTQEILLLSDFSKDEGGVLKIASVVEYVDSFKVKELKEKLGIGAQSSE